MSVTFRILQKMGSPRVVCDGELSEISHDTDPKAISAEEAKTARAFLKNSAERCPALSHNLFHYEIEIGQAKLSLDCLPHLPHFERVREILGNESVYRRWLAWIQTQQPSSEKLADYIDALSLLQRTLGAQPFRQVLSRLFQSNARNIIVQQTPSIPRIQDYPDADALQGFVVDDLPLERMVNAIWNHGDEYGEGKINAPFIACSKIVKRFPNADRVWQQLVFDFPTEAVLGTIFQLNFNEDKMTLNDTVKRPYAGFGVEIQWQLIKDEQMPWACLDETTGTTFHHNTGLWRLIPLSQNHTILWYASEHDVVGMEAPDDASIEALRNNMLAFSHAAHGRYGD